MNVVVVASREELDELYEDNALTIEGLAESSFVDFLDWIKKYTSVKRKIFYKISGEFMNEQYGLTGSNAYPDDLTICCIRLADIENVGAIIIPRFQIGGRWFNDVVDNNLAREEGAF